MVVALHEDQSGGAHKPHKKDDSEPKSLFSSGILNLGFVFGLALAGACFVASCGYMFLYEVTTFDVGANLLPTTDPQQAFMEMLRFEGHLYEARVLLLSCGIFVGLAIVFVGFCLFLVGAQGNSDAEIKGTAGFSLSVARLSPGLFTILAAAILVGFCATHYLELQILPGAPASTSGTPHSSGGQPYHMAPQGKGRGKVILQVPPQSPPGR